LESSQRVSQLNYGPTSVTNRGDSWAAIHFGSLFQSIDFTCNCTCLEGIAKAIQSPSTRSSVGSSKNHKNPAVGNSFSLPIQIGRAEGGELIRDTYAPLAETVNGRRTATRRRRRGDRICRLDDLSSEQDPLEVSGVNRMAKTCFVNYPQVRDGEIRRHERVAEVGVGQLRSQSSARRLNDRSVGAEVSESLT